MTAKEKAEELIEKQFNVDIMRCDFYQSHAKEHALICVDEIIKELETFRDLNNTYSLPYMINWQEVKKEIENI